MGNTINKRPQKNRSRIVPFDQQSRSSINSRKSTTSERSFKYSKSTNGLVKHSTNGFRWLKSRSTLSLKSFRSHRLQKNRSRIVPFDQKSHSSINSGKSTTSERNSKDKTIFKSTSGLVKHSTNGSRWLKSRSTLSLKSLRSLRWSRAHRKVSDGLVPGTTTVWCQDVTPSRRLSPVQIEKLRDVRDDKSRKRRSSSKSPTEMDITEEVMLESMCEASGEESIEGGPFILDREKQELLKRLAKNEQTGTIFKSEKDYNQYSEAVIHSTTSCPVSRAQQISSTGNIGYDGEGNDEGLTKRPIEDLKMRRNSLIEAKKDGRLSKVKIRATVANLSTEYGARSIINDFKANESCCSLYHLIKFRIKYRKHNRIRRVTPTDMRRISPADRDRHRDKTCNEKMSQLRRGSNLENLENLRNRVQKAKQTAVIIGALS